MFLAESELAVYHGNSMFFIKYFNKCLFESFFFRIDSQHLLLILIQALPIFCYFSLQDFCDGGTLHEKIVSAREVSKSSKKKNINSSATQKS